MNDHLDRHFPAYALGALVLLHLAMAVAGWWLHK